MGLDGIFLRGIKNELENFKNARVLKITQISSYELLMVLKKGRETRNLLICVSASNAKINFTKSLKKVQSKNFNFETLLKNRLRSSWFVEVKQEGLDRIIYLEFKALDEIGEEKNYVICVELFARYGNIIFYNKDTLKIEDAIKRVSLDSFSKRPVLPKLEMSFLKEQEKINILNFEVLDVVNKILSFSGLTLKKALVSCLQGVSGFVAEIFSSNFKETKIEKFGEEEKVKLFNLILFLKEVITNKNFEYFVVFKEGMPKDFTYFNVTKFLDCSFKRFNTASELLDFFYEEKSFLERQKQNKNSIFKKLQAEILKLKNKIKAREEDLENAKKKRDFKQKADLLACNVHLLKKGQKEVFVKNFYGDGEEVCLKLNPKYDAFQNVKNYYKQYKKAKIAKEKLEKLLEKDRETLNFLEEEFGFVKRCTNEEDLLEIVKELEEENIIFFKNVAKKKTKKEENESFLEFKSSDGFIIYCGKNSKQNMELTFKIANKQDIWFHASNHSGSHVVLKTHGKDVSKTAIKEAAMVAAYYSNARDEKNVDVWYTSIKNVSRKKGFKTGMVNFKNNETINVEPNSLFVQNLKISRN